MSDTNTPSISQHHDIARRMGAIIKEVGQIYHDVHNLYGGKARQTILIGRSSQDFETAMIYLSDALSAEHGMNLVTVDSPLIHDVYERRRSIAKTQYCEMVMAYYRAGPLKEVGDGAL